MELDPKTTTRILNRFVEGDAQAADELAPLVYEHLKRIAVRELAKSGKQTLQPTELVNEAWMRFAHKPDLRFDSRDGFYVLASRIMRSVLVDHSRARLADKRGGDRRPITLQGDVEGTAQTNVDILALEEALTKLEDVDRELVRLVELRFFGGLKNPEIVRALGVPLRTVERNWRVARAWLQEELSR